MSEAPNTTAQAVPGDGSENTPGAGEAGTRGKKLAEVIQKVQVGTLAVTTVVLAAGLFLLWLTKTLVGVESDAVYMALLLVPVIVLLAVTGKIESFEFLGASAKFRDLKASITDVGQREPERATYLGKLGQLITKGEQEFALIYADVDGLRKVTREKYLDQPDSGDRKREEEIRSEIIDLLELALTDAFYGAGADQAKFDVFRLVEPDIAMIVRSVTPIQAHDIARSGAERFREKRGLTTTTAVLPVAYLSALGKITPQGLDTTAANELRKAKDAR